MDTIWNCAFGLDIDVQNQPDNKYFTSCELVFSNSWKLNFQSYLGSKISIFLLHIIKLNDRLFFLSLIVYFHEFKEIIVEVLSFVFNLACYIVPSKVPPITWIRHRIGELVDKRNNEKVYF